MIGGVVGTRLTIGQDEEEPTKAEWRVLQLQNWALRKSMKLLLGERLGEEDSDE